MRPAGPPAPLAAMANQLRTWREPGPPGPAAPADRAPRFLSFARAPPATRRPPGTVLALFPRGPRSEDTDTGFLSSDTTVLSACRCSARTSLWTLSSSAGGARLLAAAGFQRFLSLPPGWGSRGACSLFGPHPPESSKPLPLARPGLGMAPRPEAHEPIHRLSEPLKCHGDKEGSQVQKGSLEGVRMNASGPSRTSLIETHLLRAGITGPVPLDDSAPPSRPPPSSQSAHFSVDSAFGRARRERT